MKIEATLIVQHFKTYELKKKSMNMEAPLNVHNFKTKPPFDKWSIPYDRGLQNTYSFCGKNDESFAMCWGCSEKSRWKLSLLVINYLLLTNIRHSGHEH